MQRKVTGFIRTLTNDYWANCSVIFRLKNSSYSADYQYPKSAVKVTTNSQGYFEIILWCNEESEILTKYIINIGGVDSWEFTLPVGTDDIDLSDLRIGGTTPETQRYPTLLTYIDEEIEQQLEAISIGENRLLLSDRLLANRDLSALRLINLQSLDYADCRDTTVYPIGLLRTSVTNNTEFSALLVGVYSDNFWNFSPNSPIFLGYNGNLSQTVESDYRQIRQIATSITRNKLLFNNLNDYVFT